jgi:hypothetical protein
MSLARKNCLRCKAHLSAAEIAAEAMECEACLGKPLEKGYVRTLEWGCAG